MLCWLAIATASLGVALIITGWLRLAALVQYLPLPVIGGYLAFIGFCESIDVVRVASCHKSVSRIHWELLSQDLSLQVILPSLGFFESRLLKVYGVLGKF